MKKTLLKKETLFDEIKEKLIESLISYAKKNFESSKNEIFNYVEERIRRSIEYRVKQEVKKYTYFTLGSILMILGSLLLIYAIFQVIAHLLQLPSFLVNLSYSLLLIFIGMIFYFNSR